MKRFYLWSLLAFCKFSFLQASVWNVDSGGVWSLSTNWNPTNVPGSPGEPTAELGNVITQNRTVTLDLDVTLTDLIFNSNVFYMIQPSNNSSLTIDSTITVSLGEHVLTAPLIMNNTNLVFDTAPGTILSISGAITGSGPGAMLIKNGNGRIILTNTVGTDFGLQLNGGLFSISAADDLGGGDIFLSGGAFHAVNSLTQPLPVTVQTSGAFVAFGGVTFTQSGLITGPGFYFKDGAGTLVLTNTGNAAAVDAPLTIRNGTVSVSSGDQLTGALSLNGGTFEASASLTQAFPLTVQTNGGEVSTPAPGITLTQTGVFSGSGPLTKTGAGELVLSGTSNTFTGNIDLQEGNISAGSLGGTGTVSMAAGTSFESLSTFPTTDRNFDLLGDSTIVVDNGHTFTVDGTLTGTSTLTKSGSGTLALGPTSAATYTAPIDIQGGTLGAASLGGVGPVTMAAGTAFEALAPLATTNRPFDLLGDSTIVVDNGHTFTVDGTLTGTSTLTKAGSGTLTLGPISAATYAAPIDIQGGTLSATSLADGGTVSVADGTTFESLAPLANSNRDFNLSGSSNISVEPGHDFTIAGLVSNNGASTIVKQGDGRLCLTNPGNGTYETLVEAGTLCITEVDALGGDRVTLNGGTLENIGPSLVHTEELVVGPNGGAINTNGSDFDQSGVVSGGGSLSKTGTGELVLSDTSNTLTGDIDLQAGKITAGSLGGTGTVTMATGTTFEPLSTFPTTDRSFDLAGDSTIFIDTGNGFTVDGTLTGAGALTKDGDGTLTLGPT
ncbi:MAG: autotransporter-associated beta strand repeat-containing protein, partial [Chlamydiota bacterium]